MRGVWAFAALLAASAPVWADDAPPLDAALARATKENKPLVLELYAEWCKPCDFFEKNVLSRADVQAALKHVVFVRYDLDSDVGSAIARKLDVHSVPTLLVLDSFGKVTARQQGVPLSDDAYIGFMAWLESKGGARAGTAELEAAVAAAPDSLATRRKLAEHYRAIGRMQDAIDQLTYIAEHGEGRRDLAAEAAAERDAIVLNETRLGEALAAAEKFVVAYPDSRLSSQRLAVLALSRRVSRERLDELAKAHLDAVVLADWPDAVRAAQIAGAESIAHRSIMDRLEQSPAEPSVHLVRAEELVLRSDRRAAYSELDQVCGNQPFTLWCYSLHQTLDLNNHIPPRLAQLRASAQHYLDGVSEPEAARPTSWLDRFDEIDARLGDAVAVALERARLNCGYLTGPSTATMVVFDLSPRGGRPRYKAYGPNADVEACVRGTLDEAWLPTVMTDRERVVGAIAFTTPRASEPAYRMPPRFGIMPELVVRRGDLETTGLRGDFRFGPRRARTSWVVGGTVEFGGGDTLEPAYLARALGGIELPRMFAGLMHVSILGGVGVSDLGTMAPRALELPLQEHMSLAVGSVRVHAWAELTPVVFGGMRSTDALFDELSYGAGASFPVFGRRFFLGAAYEERAMGRSGMFVFGVPLGELY